jgi:hypothetical protein
VRNSFLVRPVLLSVLMLCVAVGIAGAQGSVHLRYRFEAGQSYRLLATVETHSAQTLQGSPMSASMRLTTRTHFQILGVDADGVADLRSVVESVHAVQDTPMGRLEYDSADPPAALSGVMKGFGAMVGSDLTYRIRPDGSVVEVVGREAYLERMIAGVDVPPGPQGEAMLEALRGQYSSDRLSETLSSSFPLFPDRPLAPGDSWSSSQNAPGVVPMDVESTMTLTGRNAGVSTVEVRTAFKTDSTSVTTMGPMTQRFDMRGAGTGTLEIEEATGMTIRAHSEMTISGSASMSLARGEMTIPSQTRVVMTVVRDPAR